MSRQTIADYVLRVTGRHGLAAVLEQNLLWLGDVVRARRPMGLRPSVVSDAIPRVVALCSKAAKYSVSQLR